MEDTKKIPIFNKTGNLSITQFNEILPLELDTETNDLICPVVEVKPEHLQDVKVEADSTYGDDINDPNDSNSYLTLERTYPVVEVKQEDGDENDVADQNTSVKVRFCGIHTMYFIDIFKRKCINAYNDVLVYGQVTVIFVVSVGLSVCLSVCLFVQSFSQPSLIQFRSN